MLVLSASPATVMSSRASDTPTLPTSSSRWYTQLKHSSVAPLCVRTVWSSRYLARPASARLLDSNAAAPPMRKMQLESSIERSLPKYQLRVMFSVLRTTAYELGFAWSMSLARSMAIRPALHPMPPRLNDLTSSLIL
uniref:Uncharacterized protein n=1 Tax=Arundo donax TaxID=35708 RepID=A0A0A9CSP4_ARUDO